MTPNCEASFEPSGGSCAEIDECARSTHHCDDNARCDNRTGRFDCSCNAGFSGGGKECTDIDECALSAAPCGQGECENLPGSYRCGDCEPGFGPDAQDQCVDLDECALGTDN